MVNSININIFFFLLLNIFRLWGHTKVYILSTNVKAKNILIVLRFDLGSENDKALRGNNDDDDDDDDD